MDANTIINIVLKVITLICLFVVIPYIKKKYNQQQLEDTNEKILTFVQAAEQLFNDDQGEEKKAWVQEQLNKIGINANVDIINATIEACVLMLHNALKQ